MPPPPTISVLMSVYNADGYLREAVESILAQTCGDFEFLIVNDGSTDRSGEILSEFERRDPRVRVITQANAGLISALNALVEMSRGRYLARMDADDISRPERFARQVDYLDAHPDCVCVGSRVMLMDPYGSPVAETGHRAAHEEIDHELLNSSGWAMVHPVVMMRREAVVRIGMYREAWRHCEDHDLFLRLAEIGRVANLPEVLLWYRRHYQSINFTKSHEQAELKLALLKQAHERRGLTLPNDFKAAAWAPPPAGEQLQQWGWAALKVGNVRIARRHALNALRYAPSSLESWKLLYSAIRGH